MTLMSRLAAWLSKLPPAETYEVDVEKNLQIPMPDGVVLLADHYAPRHLGRRPTLLMRSPYTARTKGGWLNRLRHRLRIQVSSGAFPRWNRNLGSGEPLVSATTMRVAEQQVYHDPGQPSAVILPLC